jgi:hypothetical protein
MSNAFAGRGTELKRGDGAPTELFTTIAEMKKFPISGSKADLADVTNMDSGNYREYLPTLLTAGDLAFEGNYVPSDVTQGTLQSDFDGQVLHNWEIVLPGSRGKWTFKAYMTGLDFDFQVDKEASISGKLTITGSKTFALS